jgi:hypothetical protein
MKPLQRLLLLLPLPLLPTPRVPLLLLLVGVPQQLLQLLVHPVGLHSGLKQAAHC